MADVHVEFYGLARTRTQAETVEVSAVTLGGVARELVAKFPTLDGSCFRDGQLASAWLFNLNGEQFTRDVTTLLQDGDRVLLMSADAGG